jgi:hypothetical protein
VIPLNVNHVSSKDRYDTNTFLSLLHRQSILVMDLDPLKATIDFLSSHVKAVKSLVLELSNLSSHVITMHILLVYSV